jgi:hypothetical protein
VDVLLPERIPGEQLKALGRQVRVIGPERGPQRIEGGTAIAMPAMGLDEFQHRGWVGCATGLAPPFTERIARE